jgi:predicted porin
VHTSSTPFSGTATFNGIEANATYRITPAVLVGAAYNYTKAETAEYSQVNVGAEYDPVETNHAVCNRGVGACHRN